MSVQIGVDAVYVDVMLTKVGKGTYKRSPKHKRDDGINRERLSKGVEGDSETEVSKVGPAVVDLVVVSYTQHTSEYLGLVDNAAPVVVLLTTDSSSK